MKHSSVLEEAPDARRLLGDWKTTLRGRKVLLIEDDIELLHLMAGGFVAAGAQVDVAVDGEAGLARFMARPADLVVTDIIMPNREGIETIVALKKARPATWIIAVSGGYRVGPQDFLTLARHVGADGVLAKPLRFTDLLGMAAGLLGRQHGANAA